MFAILGDPRFAPGQVQVDCLKVNVSEATLNNLALSSTQYAVIGESTKVNGSNTYALVVDHEGVAINSPLPNRTGGANQVALFVDGNVRVTGSITSGSSLSNNAGAASPWQTVGTDSNQIFFAGTATIGGNNTVATMNQNALLIYESADRTIHHAQLAIENTASSKFSTAILGTASNSPVVFHTNNAPIEFHVRRPASYFTDMYIQPTVMPGGAISNLPAEVPYYIGVTSNTAPHMVIDASGNVGIHTHVAPTLTYLHRRELPNSVISNVTATDTMALAVAGPVFASNILIYDADSRSPKDINELFVRSAGVFLRANQILPGAFAPGPYVFPSSLAIATTTEPDYAVAVGASQHIHSNLLVDGHATLENATVSNLRATNDALFDKDVTMLQDLYVHETLHLYSGLAVAQGITGSNLSWQNVQFTLAEPGYSNINLFGAGITTPGQFGAGIGVYDSVKNQLVVYKRDTRIWEAELGDLTDPFFSKVAFIGHPLSSNATDGSLVLATPADNDPRYVRGDRYGSTVSHIYLYPGIDTSTANSNVPLIRSDNPPVLGAFTSKRVGVNTFSPKADFHVTGDVAYTGDIFKYTAATNTLTAVAPLMRGVFSTPAGVSGPPTFYGARYDDATAPHVGINTTPDIRYGLVVAGGLQSLDGFVTPNNERINSWIIPSATTDLVSAVTPNPYYSSGPVGIGVTEPQYPLEIMNRNGGGGGHTYVRLHTSANSSNVGLQMAGPSETWTLGADTTAHEVSLHANVLPTGAAPGGYAASTSNARAMRARFNPLLQKYQVSLGMDGITNYTAVLSNLDPNASVTVGGGLNVVGDVRISGNYYKNQILASSNVASNAFTLSNYTDDVYIGGQYIHLYMPTTNTSLGALTPFVSVGYADAPTLQNEVVNGSTNAVMRIYQSFVTAHPSVLRLATVNPRCYMEFVAGGKTLYMGMNENGDFSVTKSDALGAQQSFFNVSAANGWPATGFGTAAPQTVVHVMGTTTSNLLRVTRQVAAPTPGAAAALQLETLASTDSRMWQIQGPDTAYQNKLAFVYKTGTGAGAAANAAGTEVFTFAANGCMGIGNTAPLYAIDVDSTGSQGSLRLYNRNNDATPQLIFQSGSNVYGADGYLTDYRWYSFSNQLHLESANTVNNALTLLHFGATGNVGIRALAEPAYTMNVAGSLNVTERILLNGIPLFSTGGSTGLDAFDVRAANIYLRPILGAFNDTVLRGGITVNGTVATSNLFHIHAGNDANVMVYDSAYADAHVHYRVQVGPGAFEMTRQYASGNAFGWQHQAAPFGDLYVPSSAPGWCNVFGWQPAGGAGVYDFTMNGSLELGVAGYSTIKMGNDLVIEQRNGACVISQGNPGTDGVGINVSAVRGALHVANAGGSLDAGLVVENAAAATTPQAIFSKLLGNDSRDAGSSIVFSADGRAAFGALAPAAGVRADVNGVLRVASGTAVAPSMTFAGAGDGFGLFAAGGGVGVAVDGTERLRVASGGVGIGVGGASPQGTLHVRGEGTIKPVLRVDTTNNWGTGLLAGSLIVTGMGASNHVGVGTSVPDAPFHAADRFHFGGPGVFDSNVSMLQNLHVSGNVVADGNVFAAGNNLGLSDRRLKTDLVRITDAVAKVEALAGYTFTRTDTGARSTGLVAQDVEAVLPEAVGETDDGMKAVAYGNLAGLFCEAIRELKAEIVNIKQRIGLDL